MGRRGKGGGVEGCEEGVGGMGVEVEEEVVEVEGEERGGSVPIFLVCVEEGEVVGWFVGRGGWWAGLGWVGLGWPGYGLGDSGVSCRDSGVRCLGGERRNASVD